MDSKTKNIDATLWYLREKKYSVIPVRGDKRPYISWQRFQKERPSEEQVRGWFEKWPDAMIGIVTGKISGISVIDVDTEEGREEINKLIPAELIVPTAETPREGFHLYFKNPDEPLPNNVKGIPGCDFKTEGGYIIAPPSINADNKQYSWFDEMSLKEVDPPPLPPAYLRALASTIINTKNSKYKDSDDISEKMFDYGQRDNGLFHIANQLVKSRTPRQEIFEVLKNLIRSWGEEPVPKWINAKIDSALKRSSKHEKTVVEEVEEYISSSTGVFTSSEVAHSLQRSSREEKKNISKILNRMREKGELERYGNKNGVFRIVDSTCDDIDFLSASEEPIDIKWPFEIEDLVNTLPKSIIIVAGESDAGKTAFLLNVVKMNMYEHEIYYFSSEMGSSEMKTRLSKFNMPLEDWNFTPKERVSDFADVIRPDAINIIDFLEIYEDFFKISKLIKEIFDKLNKGIAIIAIQKNKGNEYGLGGARSLEKARLYLAIESDEREMNRIKIVKAKNWVTSEKNPNKLEREFKLFNGCQFLEESGGWMKPDKSGKKQKK